MVKNLPANAGDRKDAGSIPGSGRYPGEANGDPLQYSCLENPMDRGVWQAVVHEIAKSWTLLKQLYAPTSNAEEAEVERFYEDLQDLLELTPQKDVLFIIGDWNAKVGSQETPGVTGKLCLGIRNEAGQMLIEFAKRTHWL